MILNQPIKISTSKEKKSKDSKKKPGSGTKRKRPNTSSKEEPNKVSTWMYEFKGTDYGLNYFL
jgi:hypothetical protein